MIATIARVIMGFLLACLAAGLAIVLFVLTPVDLASSPSGTLVARGTDIVVWSLLSATHAAIFAFIFALIATGLAEWLAIRSVLYYVFAGLVIALLGFYAQLSSEAAGQPTIMNGYALAAFAAAGALAGLVYWLAAGRRAGGRAADIASDFSASGTRSGDRPRLIVEDTPIEVATPTKAHQRLQDRLKQDSDDSREESVTIVSRDPTRSGSDTAHQSKKTPPSDTNPQSA